MHTGYFNNNKKVKDKNIKKILLGPLQNRFKGDQGEQERELIS